MSTRPHVHYAAVLQAMLSSSSEFFGDFEHHQEVCCTLDQLLTQAQQQQQQQGESAAAGTQHASKMHLYLAQQPLQGPGESCGVTLQSFQDKLCNGISKHSKLQAHCCQTLCVLWRSHHFPPSNHPHVASVCTYMQAAQSSGSCYQPSPPPQICTASLPLPFSSAASV
jgi:hypothetical protein